MITPLSNPMPSSTIYAALLALVLGAGCGPSSTVVCDMCHIEKDRAYVVCKDCGHENWTGACADCLRTTRKVDRITCGECGRELIFNNSLQQLRNDIDKAFEGN